MGNNTPTATILVAEDDPEIRQALSRILNYEGYEVVAVNDGAAALEAAVERSLDLAVLDVMMPFVDGLTVCRKLRSAGNALPILILTARRETSDKVAGLDAGADDYLAKPFDMEELLARIRALLRRSTAENAGDVLTVGPISLDAARYSVTVDGGPVDLTRTEFSILELLMRNVDLVMERSVIYDRVWGYDFGGDSRSLDVHVGYLRRKLEAAGTERLIETVRGVGFVLRPGRPG
ncbi:MAG: response regulator transcription factor [Acidimicrobiia bacterium]|nr:response regulator transcription factor [Acidimicrobiia bacterium]